MKNKIKRIIREIEKPIIEKNQEAKGLTQSQYALVTSMILGYDDFTGRRNAENEIQKFSRKVK